MGGANTLASTEYVYPKPLIEIGGKPMIEHVVSALHALPVEKRFVFIVNARDCSEYHLHDVLRLVGGENSIIIQLEKETKGAACSCLLAIEHIDPTDKLLISNSDQVLLAGLHDGMTHFFQHEFDAGVFTFEAVHPKWSFARLDENALVIETAEKRPISRNAIAGLYYFSQARLFFDAAMTSIRKDSQVNGLYYIAPVMNELVLQNRKIGTYRLNNPDYVNFYSPQRIRDFEDFLNQKRHYAHS